MFIELPCKGRGVGEFARELAAFLEWGLLYVHDSDVVEINENELDDSIVVPSTFTIMDQVRFRTWIENHVRTGIMQKKDEDTLFLIETSISETDAKAVLYSDSFKESLPRIQRVIDFPMPIEHKGEIIVPVPGYNEELQTYLHPNGPELRPVDLWEAKAILCDELLGGFCFKVDDDGQSKTHAIARILTPYFRGIIGLNERIPFWNFRANRPRAGKDYLAR